MKNHYTYGYDEDSEIFIEKLMRYIRKQAETLNHLDLSGMGFRPKQLINISLVLVEAPMLCSIHLNDNGLYDMGMFESHDNKRTVEEIFDIFGV